MKKNIELFNAIVAAACLIVGYFIFREFFSVKLPNFAYEILAAVVGTIFTIAAMSVLLTMQSQAEQKREFSTKLFELKMTIYKEILDSIFSMDDDGLIEEDEIIDLENKIGSAGLVSGVKLMKSMTRFLVQLKKYGRMYFRNMNRMQKEKFMEELQGSRKTEISDAWMEAHFVSLDELIQAMRKDLKVVEGNINEIVEEFVDLPYDKYKLIENPNIVE